MKKIDLGQTITIFANLGVLVGILLLVFELNQNSQMMQAQTRNAISQTLVDLLVVDATDDELVAINMKEMSGQSFTPSEEYVFSTSQEAYWRYRENVHYQYRMGLYEEAEYLAQRVAWLSLLDSSEMRRKHYCSRRGSRSELFGAEIEALMENPCD